jgi:hypothetical protein
MASRQLARFTRHTSIQCIVFISIRFLINQFFLVKYLGTLTKKMSCFVENRVFIIL